MAGGHGGARVPSNPAAVSGPGALSQRTDGQPITDLPNAGYGENAAYREIQGGAQVGGAPPGGGGGGGADLAAILGGLTPMGAPSQNPDQPVTAGGVYGPGGGPESLGMPMNLEDETRADIEAMSPGLVQAMLRAAQQPGASRAFKRMVRKVIANRPS